MLQRANDEKARKQVDAPLTTGFRVSSSTTFRTICENEFAAEAGGGEMAATLVKTMDGKFAATQHETLKAGISTHRYEASLEPPVDLEGLNHEDVTTTVVSRITVVSLADAVSEGQASVAEADIPEAVFTLAEATYVRGPDSAAPSRASESISGVMDQISAWEAALHVVRARQG